MPNRLKVARKQLEDVGRALHDDLACKGLRTPNIVLRGRVFPLTLLGKENATRYPQNLTRGRDIKEVERFGDGA